MKNKTNMPKEIWAWLDGEDAGGWDDTPDTQYRTQYTNTAALIEKLEGIKLDEAELHINYQIEPYNTAIDAIIKELEG